WFRWWHHSWFSRWLYYISVNEDFQKVAENIGWLESNLYLPFIWDIFNRCSHVCHRWTYDNHQRRHDEPLVQFPRFESYYIRIDCWVYECARYGWSDQQGSLFVWYVIIAEY